MWNSPHSHSKSGKRYALADLSALVLPLDVIEELSVTVQGCGRGELIWPTKTGGFLEAAGDTRFLAVWRSARA